MGALKTVVVRMDTSGLDKLLEQLPYRMTKATDVFVNAVADDIDANWSSSSPSAPGKPPAVVTGDLKRSRKITISSKWRTKNAFKLEFTAEHAGFLEYGTLNADGSTRMEARPFFRPAILRAKKHLPKAFAPVVQVDSISGMKGIEVVA